MSEKAREKKKKGNSLEGGTVSSRKLWGGGGGGKNRKTVRKGGGKPKKNHLGRIRSYYLFPRKNAQWAGWTSICQGGGAERLQGMKFLLSLWFLSEEKGKLDTRRSVGRSRLRHVRLYNGPRCEIEERSMKKLQGNRREA